MNIYYLCFHKTRMTCRYVSIHQYLVNSIRNYNFDRIEINKLKSAAHGVPPCSLRFKLEMWLEFIGKFNSGREFSSNFYVIIRIAETACARRIK